MASLKLFLDALSQPCRAVMILLEANKVPYEACIVKVAEGEHHAEDFSTKHPFCKVPAIDDGGFYLSESATIMKYLVQKHQLPDHWYPSDVEQRAKINEYLDWHHQNLRVGAAHTIYHQVFAPKMFGTEPNAAKKEETMAVLRKSEKLLENYFLKGTKFISGNEISIADLQAVCEFSTFWVTGLELFKDKPRLAQWMEDCQKELQPHFDKAHEKVYLVRDKGIFKGKL